jgi:hypothetical protein
VNEDSIQARLQITTQLVALAALVLYAVGFLTISIHHAHFGIAQFSLLRPKIVFAGILFLVFFALPVLEAGRIFGLWGLGVPPNQQSPEAAPPPLYSKLYRVVGFLIAAMATSAIIRPLMDRYDPNWKWMEWSAIMFAWAVAVAIAIRRLGRHSIVCLVLVSSAILLFPLGLWRIHDATLYCLIGWFCWSAYVGHQANGLVQNPAELRNAEWHIGVTLTIGTVAFFAVLIYPRVGPQLGGGAPTSATLQFVNKSPIDDSARMQLWLLDETDAGFYVLRAAEDNKAIFIPRGAVAAIYFGQQAQATTTAPPQPAQQPAPKQ